MGRDRKRAKALFWDGTGLCLYAKRLEKGRFTPLWQRESGAQPLELPVSELALLLEGSELVGRARCRLVPYTLEPLFQPETTDAVTS